MVQFFVSICDFALFSKEIDFITDKWNAEILDGCLFSRSWIALIFLHSLMAKSAKKISPLCDDTWFCDQTLQITPKEKVMQSQRKCVNFFIAYFGVSHF